MTTPDPILVEYAEGTTTHPESLTVLWKGENLALIKSKAGKSYDGRYRHAEVELILHGHGHMGGRGQPYHLSETVWVCDRRRAEGPKPGEDGFVFLDGIQNYKRPISRGRLTPTVIEGLIEAAQDYEANVWPGIIAERLEAERQRREREEAERQAREERQSRHAVVSEALSALIDASMEGDAITILQAAKAYREVRQSQEAA